MTFCHVFMLVCAQTECVNLKFDTLNLQFCSATSLLILNLLFFSKYCVWAHPSTKYAFYLVSMRSHKPTRILVRFF